jgi:hypothetical protein
MAAAMCRQGDVLLIRVDSLPDGSRRRAGGGGRLLLAHGEAAGQHHWVDAADAELTVTDAGEVFLQVVRPAWLEHQLHRPIRVEPGTYRVVRQCDYAPGEYRPGALPKRSLSSTGTT